MKKKKSASKLLTPPRRSVRFQPDPLTIAVISLEEKLFKPAIVGLVLNESFGGCSILINHDDGLKKDKVFAIKVGQLAVLRAKVIWNKNLEESIYKVGFKFVD